MTTDRLLMGFCIALALSGCAGSTTLQSGHHLLASEDEWSTKLVLMRPGDGEGTGALKMAISIILDGGELLTLRRKEAAVVYVKPGKHELLVRNSYEDAFTEATREYELDCVAGEELNLLFRVEHPVGLSDIVWEEIRPEEIRMGAFTLILFTDEPKGENGFLVYSLSAGAAEKVLESISRVHKYPMRTR